MSDEERAMMGRPTYPQRHPVMGTARNIVNQILDEAGTDLATRQRINDDCDQFVAWMVETYATGGRAPQPTDWEDRQHSDAYCVTHCKPGTKHSQCGCSCDHKATDSEGS
ncbi:MAG: hypothetical protein ACRCYU_01960 [Nocardioides sp.]